MVGTPVQPKALGFARGALPVSSLPMPAPIAPPSVAPSTPPTVYVVAAMLADASNLVANLEGALGANGDFYLKACNHQQLQTPQLAAHDAVLLMAPALGASNTQSSQAQDLTMQLRQALVAQQQHFQVLFAQGDALVNNAMSALCNWFPQATALQARRAALREHGNLARWAWACDTCSDPECELRLFKGLVDPA